MRAIKYILLAWFVYSCKCPEYIKQVTIEPNKSGVVDFCDTLFMYDRDTVIINNRCSETVIYKTQNGNLGYYQKQKPDTVLVSTPAPESVKRPGVLDRALNRVWELVFAFVCVLISLILYNRLTHGRTVSK